MTPQIDFEKFKREAESLEALVERLETGEVPQSTIRYYQGKIEVYREVLQYEPKEENHTKQRST